MQFFHRFSLLRSSFRFLSSSIVDVTPSTTQKELYEITKLMQTYNNSHLPIRTLALFEWMTNITNIKPDFLCCLQIIHACGEGNHLTICQKIHQLIDQDQTLQTYEHRQLQIKLIYMYAKIKHIELAEQLFQKAKDMKNLPIDISLFGTMFKAYNMNGQAEKTIILYEKELLNRKTIELDAISATCILSACSDCRRLDIGKYVHEEVIRLKLLHPSNIRLATAIMDMYCNCGSIDRARQIFNQSLPSVDHVAYSTMMKAYLSTNQPVEVLSLFQQLRSSSVSPDSILYLYVISACDQLGLPHPAENIHRSIPSYMIEKNRSIQTALVAMHAHCLHIHEADRLFRLIKEKDNRSLASLIHGYAINGQGNQALKLFEETKLELKFNEQVYQMVLYACAFTGGLVNEAQRIYKAIPEKHRTSEVAAVMVSVLTRASLFDEAQSFIHQYNSTSQSISPLWSAFFLACYHAGNLQYAKLIYKQILNDRLSLLLFSDMTNSQPSNETMNYFRQHSSGICWTETNYTIHEFHDDDSLSKYPLLSSELNGIIGELKSVGVHWELAENDLKKLFCGHIAMRLAVAQNFISISPTTPMQLTKTKPICSVCHEGMKQLTLIRQCDIFLKDSLRVHHFHNGICSCHDKF